MLKNVIAVAFTMLKFVFAKIVYGKRFSYKGIQRFSPCTEVSLENKAIFSLGKKVRAHTGTRIRVRKGAKVIIGNDVAFSYNCLLTAHDSIQIGDGCEIGPGVMFFDHDHDFRAEGGVKTGEYKTAPIEIGKNVWIGANVIILKGTIIGDNCVIAAGSIVKGIIPSDTLFVQKRLTEIRQCGGAV